MTQSGYSLVFGAFLLVGAAICWICGYAAGRISGWNACSQWLQRQIQGKGA